jgi:hypothetical protein
VTLLVCVVVNASGPYGDLDNVDVKSIEVNRKDVLQSDDYIRGVERGDTIDVEVEFEVLPDSPDLELEVRAEITGDGHRDVISDSTDEFKAHAGTTYTKKLQLELPSRMDLKEDYQLRVEVSTAEHAAIWTGKLDIGTVDHAIEIKEPILSPENEVKAGRALLVSARVRNRGSQKEEDLKVKASIPALGISASDYIDNLDPEDCNKADPDDCDDATTSEELYMRIPDCAEPGQYTVRVCVEYDDGDEEDCTTTPITVVESDTCVVGATQEPSVGKTIITIGPETQDIAVGSSAMYPVTIANSGTESKVYSISVDSANWADFTVTPSNVMVVGAGESKTAYVSVKPKDDASGTQVFSVTIKSGETTLKQVPLQANVVGGAVSASSLSSIKRALEIGLVVLVVLLVILALIIGFNKLKGSDEEETGEEKTYY